MRAICLALALLAFAPQDKGGRKLEWKLPPGHVAEYSYLDKAGKPLPDQKLLIFGSELTPSSNRIAIDAYENLPIALVFQLPPEAMKAGLGWEHASYYFNDAFDALGGFEAMAGGSIKPVCARGRYVAKIARKGDDEIATIDGALQIFEVRRDLVNGALKITVSKVELGTLATSAQYSLNKGLILKAGWQYKAKAQDRENGRVVEKRIETHAMIELKEDVELDAAKVQPAIEQSITRAVDWLKKQQKNGAWGASKQGTSEPTYLTSLVVRALVAAGVKPDDPVLAAASRTIRATPPQENFTLMQQILALTCKSPSKEELDDARRFADELYKRRDARNNGWASVGGRNDLPNAFLTAFALEALASVPDSKVPEDALRSGLEFFTGNWIEEDGKVDLELEFEKDAATIAPDPKKDVVAASWPAVVGRAANDLRAARKGSFFTQVAALRVLLLLPERLKMDERQLKTLDLPLRRGLANLQLRWTLRSVPPIEASWCAQRMEYLGMLGSTLSKAKLDRIAGCDWRLEGATLLMRDQGDDGSWFAGTDAAVNKTAHALLFLSAARR